MEDKENEISVIFSVQELETIESDIGVTIQEYASFSDLSIEFSLLVKIDELLKGRRSE